jgi:hypothetical protein
VFRTFPASGIGADAIEVHATNLRVPRHHRLQARGTELDGLLHHVVEAGVLERGKQVMQIAGRTLRPGPLRDFEHAHPAGRPRQDRPPFPIAAVEDQDGIAGLEPQHREKVVRLCPVKLDRGAGGQRRIEMETGAAEVVASHGESRLSRIGSIGASACAPG